MPCRITRHRHNKKTTILIWLAKISQPCIISLLLISVALLYLENVDAREADKRSYFLYAEGQCKDPCPVHDYQLHITVPEDETEEQKTEEKENEEDEAHALEHARPDKPFFLQPRNNPRVVEFYSPWCG